MLGLLADDTLGDTAGSFNFERLNGGVEGGRGGFLHPPLPPDTSPLQQTENTGNFKLEGEEEERMLALALEEMGTINPHGLTHFLFNKIAFLFAFLIKKRKRKVTPT